ncbi:unnamed protein product [Leptosia nina]|uniref:Uncharacterized protein n=1 Tax=Leptosia nina TaxID=320188 RepID=A0AAV1IVA9_9NEOP
MPGVQGGLAISGDSPAAVLITSRALHRSPNTVMSPNIISDTDNSVLEEIVSSVHSSEHLATARSKWRRDTCDCVRAPVGGSRGTEESVADSPPGTAGVKRGFSRKG